MVNFYIYRINEGKMTTDEVPNLWRAKVKEKLNISTQYENME